MITGSYLQNTYSQFKLDLFQSYFLIIDKYCFYKYNIFLVSLQVPI